MKNIENFKSFSKGVIFYLLCILGIYLGIKLFVFYMPFLFAFIISQILEPIIKFINKKTGLTRKSSSILVLAIFFVLIIFLITWGVVLLISETTNLLGGFNEYLEKIIIFVQNLGNKINLDKINLNNEIQRIFENTVAEFINEIGKFVKNFLTKFLNGISSLPTIFIYVIITILSTYFIASDKFYIIDQMEYHFPKKWVGKIRENVRKIVSSLGSYLKAEVTMIIISFFIVLIGLVIFNIFGFNIEYPVIMALLIGFVDALPILGCGTILIPWSIICFINQDISLASSLLGLYIFTIISKQFIEPKIVSNKIGIHPIYTLIAMYTGFKFLGVIGLLVGPILLIVFKNIFSNTIDKGIVNSIIEKG